MNRGDYEGHTPGPWVATPLGKGRPLGNIERVSTTPDDGHLNLIARSAAEFDSEVEPNAKLIAAAPDLLAEVKHLRSKVRQLIQSDLQLLNKHGDCYYCGHDMMEDIPSCGVKHTEKNPTVDEIFEKEMKR